MATMVEFNVLSCIEWIAVLHLSEFARASQTGSLGIDSCDILYHVWRLQIASCTCRLEKSSKLQTQQAITSSLLALICPFVAKLLSSTAALWPIAK